MDTNGQNGNASGQRALGTSEQRQRLLNMKEHFMQQFKEDLVKFLPTFYSFCIIHLHGLEQFLRQIDETERNSNSITDPNRSNLLGSIQCLTHGLNKMFAMKLTKITGHFSVDDLWDKLLEI